MENQRDMVAPKYKIWLHSCSNAAGGGESFNAVDLVFHILPGGAMSR